MRIAWVFVALAACEPVPAADSCGPSNGMVERVIDGDTVVIDGRKIRYLLVDAPETTEGKHDCFGDNAAAFNTALVLGKRAELEYDVACEDRYGRTLAYVRVGDVDVNRTMIERGYGCLLHIPPDGDGRAAEFGEIEAEARVAGRGLWGECSASACR